MNFLFIIVVSPPKSGHNCRNVFVKLTRQPKNAHRECGNGLNYCLEQDFVTRLGEKIIPLTTHFEPYFIIHVLKKCILGPTYHGKEPKILFKVVINCNTSSLLDLGSNWGSDIKAKEEGDFLQT